MGMGSLLFTEGLSTRGEKKDRKTGENKGDNWAEKRGRGEVDEKEDMSMKEGKWSEKKELRSLKGSNLWHWESCHFQYDYSETGIWGLESLKSMSQDVPVVGFLMRGACYCVQDTALSWVKCTSEVYGLYQMCILNYWKSLIATFPE